MSPVMQAPPGTVALDTWHLVGNAGEPTFQNGWLNYDTSLYNAAGFRKDPTGRVALKGLVKSGTVGNVPIFTLPAGYRPVKEILLAPSNNTVGNPDVRVSTNGDVKIGSGVNTWLSLDDIEFDTETVLSLPGVSAAVSSLLDIWHSVGGSGEPAFLGGWTNSGAGYQTLQFRKDPFGRVLIRGYIGGTNQSGAAIFVLPVGYRPPATIIVPAVSGSGANLSYLEVRTDGSVLGVMPGASGNLHVDQQFDTDTVTTYLSGPQGPPGPQGLPGTTQPSWLGYWIPAGSEVNSGPVTNASGTAELTDSAANKARVLYTPPVAGVFTYVVEGIASADDAAWVRCDIVARILRQSDNVQLVTQASTICYCHVSGTAFDSFRVENRCNVLAGVGVYGAAFMNVTSGTWHFWQGAAYLRAFAEFVPS